MKINVKSKDFGFWTQTPISVTKRQDGEVVWCNHAGAIEEERENVYYRSDQPDIIWNSRVLICGCGAYQIDNENYWWDAPIGGLSG